MKNNIFYVVGSARPGSTLIYNAISSNINFNPGIPENHLADRFCGIFAEQLDRNKNIEKKTIFKNSKEIENYFKESLNIFFEKI